MSVYSDYAATILVPAVQLFTNDSDHPTSPSATRTNPFNTAADGYWGWFEASAVRRYVKIRKTSFDDYPSPTAPLIVDVEKNPEASITFEDEGTPVTQRSTVNVTGAGASVLDSGGKTVFNVPGATLATDTLWDAAGDLAKGTGTDTAARLARGSANQILRVNSGATDIEWGAPAVGDLLDWQFARKIVDESVTSSAALQDDDSLLFAIGTNGIWSFRFVLFVDAGIAGDIHFGVQGPAGASGRWGGIGLDSAVMGPNGDVRLDARGTLSGGSDIGTLGGTGGVSIILIEGVVVNGATSGNVTLRWAQATSDATATTVKTHSHLIARRVA